MLSRRAIVFGYNLPGVNNLTLTRDQLVGIYNGTYRFWNDPVFAVLNPKVAFPAAPIIPVARFDSSGTTTTFTRALSTFSEAWNRTYGIFSSHTSWNSSVVKNFGQRTTGIADTLTNIPFSIGYLTLQSINEVNLPHALIINRFSKVMDGTTEAVEAAVNAVEIQQNNGLYTDLVDVSSPDAYPIVCFSYFLIHLTYTEECRQAVELASYILWFTGTDQASSEAWNLLMIPVSTTLATMIREQILEKMTCAGENVLDLLARQTYDEQESRKTWKIPVIIVTPLIAVIILCLIAYALRQKFKYIRMLDRNDWNINFFDIDFRSPKSRRQVKAQNSPDIQLDECQPGNFSPEDGELSGHPGKLDSQCINVKPIRIPIEIAAINRKFRQTLMVMRETLNHVNVARFYGLTTSQNGDVFLVEEFCDRGRLDELLRQHQYNLEENALFAIAGDIANGMEFLHHQGIIHGCLKTSCCLIDSRWSVKITDWEYNTMYTILRKLRQNRNCEDFQKSFLFQLSRHLSSAKAEDIAYHEFWSPPEVLKYMYLSEPTKAADVYSFGLILYEIFTIGNILDDIKQTEVFGGKRINELYKLTRKEALPPKVLHIIEIACTEEFSRRPTFEHLLMMIRTANPRVKYGVLECMMDTIEAQIKQLEEKTLNSGTGQNNCVQVLAQSIPMVDHGREIGGFVREYEVVLLGVSVQVQWIASATNVSRVITGLEYLFHLVEDLLNNNNWISRVEAVSDCAVLAVGLSRPFSASDVSELTIKALEIDRSMTAKWSELFQAEAGSFPSESFSVVSTAIHFGTVFGGSRSYADTPRCLVCGEALDTCRKLINVMASKKRLGLLITGPIASILRDSGRHSISPVGITIKVSR